MERFSWVGVAAKPVGAGAPLTSGVCSMSMSKLGRHRRTITLPDEEPWVIPAPVPEKRIADPEPAAVPVPARQPKPVPAAPARV